MHFNNISSGVEKIFIWLPYLAAILFSLPSGAFFATKLSLVALVREARLRKWSFAKHPRRQAELG